LQTGDVDQLASTREIVAIIEEQDRIGGRQDVAVHAFRDLHHRAAPLTSLVYMAVKAEMGIGRIVDQGLAELLEKIQNPFPVSEGLLSGEFAVQGEHPLAHLEQLGN